MLFDSDVCQVHDASTVDFTFVKIFHIDVYEEQ